MALFYSHSRKKSSLSVQNPSPWIPTVAISLVLKHLLCGLILSSYPTPDPAAKNVYSNADYADVLDSGRDCYPLKPLNLSTSQHPQAVGASFYVLNLFC